ncbi:carbohydrate kinase FGGY [Kribbella flavida DSM 17836]|uniref:Carbohydrate kinase FGGY n=1 Tax=Kribbella flavida (strain DSM 17836 / JCM 10339 / NBRC 14399) TaxID=479435 RepID=D2Q403_KRIFD|nr:FGGY family carbohydrate kinase [Kribbella flavida]ADB30317.1 carbohydrate kinase FGGY [Kribbella flavida DSM 17836]
MPRTDDRSGTRVLALDLGTSSARALVLLAEDASPVPGALARHKIAPTYSTTGSATIDLHAYVEGLLSCLDELQQNGHLEDIAAIVLSSQWHSIVGLDARGAALTPVITWADTRSVQPQLDPAFDERAFHARTGSWLHRLYWPRRIPWLLSEVPAVSFAGLPDLVLERLTGERVTSVSIASGTGSLDLATGEYDAEALAIAGITADRLPVIVPTGWTGVLSASYARRWPGLAGVPVHPPTGDGAASNVGTGGYDESTAAVTVGTSAAVRVVHPIDQAPELPWELWRYRVDDKRAVTGMAFSAAGNLHAWLTTVLQLDEHHQEPTGIEIGSSRVIAIPFQAGTRPPETVPGGSGVYFGLSFDDTAADLLAASLQGASLEIDRGLRMLDALFGRELQVVLGGGGIDASAWWRRCLTATFARPAVVCAEAEVGARGAAAVALGLSPAPGGEHLDPSPEEAERVAALRPRYSVLRTLAVQAAPELKVPTGS